MVASHVYNQQICGITDRDIEEGYHVKRVRPHEGMRVCYAPREEIDFQFTELNTRVVSQQAALTNTNTTQSPFGDTPVYQVRPTDIMYTHQDYGGGSNPTDGEADAE